MSSKMVPQAPEIFLEFQIKNDWAKSSETYLLHFDTHVGILYFALSTPLNVCSVCQNLSLMEIWIPPLIILATFRTS